MKIFVTGGTGNIGQHVTLALAARGHQVELLTRTPDRIPAFQTTENVHVVQGCLQEPEGMKAALQGCDAVIHIALGWGYTPEEMLENDTRVTAFLLDAAEQAGVKTFIYTSSTAATGPLRSGMDETALRMPNDLYGATKAATEVYLMGFRQYYSRKGGYGEPVRMRRNVIRPGYTYSSPAVPGGASQSDKRFAAIAEGILQGKDLTFPRNDGTQFLSSRQIAQVYVALVESDLNEEIFFALGQNYITWYEIACMAKEMVPESPSRIIAEGEPEAPSLYCVDKIDRVFGLRFDGGDDLKEHIAWNLERARAKLAGEDVYNPVHSY